MFSKKKVGSRTVFRLTAIGKDKAQNMEAEGKTMAILDYLDSAGPSTLGDIASQTHTNEEDTRVTVRKMLASRYVEVVDEVNRI